MVAGRLDGCLARRMEQCILNGSVQGQAEPQLVWSLGSSLVPGILKSFIFKPFKPPARKYVCTEHHSTIYSMEWSECNV